MLRRFPYSFIVCLLTLLTLPAWAEMPSIDLAGSQDHVLVNRFPGSMIVASRVGDNEDVKLVGGKVGWGRGSNGKDVLKLESPLNIEGRHTEIVYNFPADHSAIEVIRSFQIALQKSDFTLLYTCARGDCGALAVYALSLIDPLFTTVGASNFYREPFNVAGTEGYYLLAKDLLPDGRVVFASIFVVPPKGKYNGGIFLEVVEPSPLEAEPNIRLNDNEPEAPPLHEEGASIVPLPFKEVDADQLIAAFKRDGKVVVYGIQFDSDKTEIKAEAEPTMIAIAKLLSSDPKLNVFIVVHTDNIGNYTHNAELSQKRADVIASTLTKHYNIEGQRIWAKGGASLYPIANNDTEDGRAKNRRVEIVKQ